MNIYRGCLKNKDRNKKLMHDTLSFQNNPIWSQKKHVFVVLLPFRTIPGHVWSPNSFKISSVNGGLSTALDCTFAYRTSPGSPKPCMRLGYTSPGVTSAERSKNSEKVQWNPPLPMTDPWDWYIHLQLAYKYLHLPYKSAKCREICQPHGSYGLYLKKILSENGDLKSSLLTCVVCEGRQDGQIQHQF